MLFEGKLIEELASVTNSANRHMLFKMLFRAEMLFEGSLIDELASVTNSANRHRIEEGCSSLKSSSVGLCGVRMVLVDRSCA